MGVKVHLTPINGRDVDHDALPGRTDLRVVVPGRETSSMTGRSFVDTNVLVYAADEGPLTGRRGRQAAGR